MNNQDKGTNIWEEWPKQCYEDIKGKLIGYTDKECCNCGRLRVEEFDSGVLICEKCGTDQKTKETYENQYGSWNDYDNA